MNCLKHFILISLLSILAFGCTSKPPEGTARGEETFVTEEGPGSNGVGDWESSGADGMEPPSDMPIFGGDWESSGGDGVICFADQEALEKSQPFLKSRDLDYLEENLKSLNVLEYYEYFKMTPENKVWAELRNLETEQEMVDKVLGRVRRYSPIFAQKMDLVLKSIKTDEWIPLNELLSDIEDSAPAVDIPNNCQLIQLAERKTISVKYHLPQVEVYFDEFFYKKLSTVNKALLIFHEALYLIAKEGGHINSDFIRGLNATLFSDVFDRTIEREYFSQSANDFRAGLDIYFGDYIRFFINEDIYQDEADYVSIKHANNFTRSKSFIELNTAMRSKMRDCLSVGGTKRKCIDGLMLGDELKLLVDTDEKAFLFLMNYVFDLRGLAVGASEDLYVLDHEDPQEQDDNIQLVLSATCETYEDFTEEKAGELSRSDEGLLLLGEEDAGKIIQGFKDEDEIWLKDFMLPSLRYCREIRKALRGN